MLLVSETIPSEVTGRVWPTERHHWSAGAAKNRAQLMPAGTSAFLIVGSTFPITGVTGGERGGYMGFLQLPKKSPELPLSEGRNGAAVEAKTSCALGPAKDTEVSLTKESNWR